ncbi:MAG: hypothetical protein QW517_07485 [Thermofilaceae archaeon]
MARLPKEFLEWNYYARRELLLKVSRGFAGDQGAIFRELAARHNAVLCTAASLPDGSVEVNGKVVGVGYVLKREFLGEAVERLEEHLRLSDEALLSGGMSRQEVLREHAERGLKLLLELVYLEPGLAEERVDFEKLASLELALNVPHSSRHTWSILQRSRKACIVFLQPPSISYEVRCTVSIHEGDEYWRLVNLVHDAFHYTPPERRSLRPAYIFHVEEVYDNGATPAGFGRRLA